jgi:hypothetical protein
VVLSPNLLAIDRSILLQISRGSRDLKRKMPLLPQKLQARIEAEIWRSKADIGREGMK